jgi:hypothetical protein
MKHGKPRGNPLTSILDLKLSVYGDPTDSQLREISGLMPREPMYDWFNKIWIQPDHIIHAEVEQKLLELWRKRNADVWKV